jgi:hypothetical protein
MSAALTTIASVTAADVTGADMFGGIVALVVALVSFLAISGLALSMTLGASKSPGAMAVTGIAGLLSVIVAVGLYMTITSSHAPTPGTWESIGSILALLLGIVAFLALGGLAVVMTIGAFAPSKQPITSWPNELEQTFHGFDNRNAQSQSRAWTFAIASAVLTFVLAIGIYKGVTPDIKDITKDMNMSNLTKKSKSESSAPKKEAPAPKAEEPKAEEPKQ